MLVVLILGALLLHGLARIADVVVRADDATRGEANAEAILSSTERALRALLGEAGTAMPAAPNLSGVGIRTGEGASALDTLIVLQANGPGLFASTHGCPGGDRSCVAVTGDYRSDLRQGDLLLVGNGTTGMAALEVTAAPALFHAPCGADCEQRLVCPVDAGVPTSVVRIVGSIREPSGVSSDAPCPQAEFPDGSSCREIEQRIDDVRRMMPVCRTSGRTMTYTALTTRDRTAELGFLPAPLSLGAGGARRFPAVRVLRAQATRIWVRGEGSADSVLVRQVWTQAAGGWSAPRPIASSVTAMKVETLQTGRWERGTGSPDLSRDPANPNYLVSPGNRALQGQAAWGFREGHHTLAAVRVTIDYSRSDATSGEPGNRTTVVMVSTGKLLNGGESADGY